jgi:hypothetical protein
LVAFFVLLSVVVFVELSCANILALVPATIPARAALAIANFTDFVMTFSYCVVSQSVVNANQHARSRMRSRPAPRLRYPLWFPAAKNVTTVHCSPLEIQPHHGEQPSNASGEKICLRSRNMHTDWLSVDGGQF